MACSIPSRSSSGFRSYSFRCDFMVKRDSIGTIARHNERLVVRGIFKTNGEWYMELYAAVLWLKIVRVMLSKYVSTGWEFEQLGKVELEVKGDFELHVAWKWQGLGQTSYAPRSFFSGWTYWKDAQIPVWDPSSIKTVAIMNGKCHWKTWNSDRETCGLLLDRWFKIGTGLYSRICLRTSRNWIKKGSLCWNQKIYPKVVFCILASVPRSCQNIELRHDALFLLKSP